MTRSIPLTMTAALAMIAAPLMVSVPPARADVTVVYAPPAPRAPLVARPVGPTERTETRAIVPPRAPRAATPAAPAASAEPPPVPPIAPRPEPAARIVPCVSPRPTAIARGGASERASLALTDCSGRADPASVAELSLLARPAALATRPGERDLAAHASDPDWVAPGIRRLHPGLAERLRALADRFPDHVIEVVAGFRPDAREGSRHLFGVAIDVRVRGASLDAVHAFVRRFDRTGVGLIRSAGVIHLDVRPGSVAWIDESAPGEPPRIVADDAPRGGALVRAPSSASLAERDRAPRAVSQPPAPAAVPASSAREGEDRALDPDTIADQVLRGLGELPLPSAPPR